MVIENSNAPEGELKLHLLADKLEADGVSLGRAVLAGNGKVRALSGFSWH